MNSRYEMGRPNVKYELGLEGREHFCQIEHRTAATARLCNELLPSVAELAVARLPFADLSE